ncbi:MAG TPA: hypothetical protein VFE32_17390 [Puia sp.]|jgi:hypothetical protein|nr:hypothetical protein [Puia sp.]
MSFSIISPPNSFVDFNPPVDILCPPQPDISLPAYNDFGIQFQLQVSGDLPAASGLKLVICDADGNKILDQGIMVQNLCYQYRLSVAESAFPVIVNAGQPIPAGSYDFPSFLAALGAVVGTDIPSTQFDYCCLFPALSIVTSTGTITFGAFWDYGFAVYPQTNMSGLLRIGDCFRYGIADGSGNVIAFSNKFRRVGDTCYSTFLAYWNDDDAYGFSYPTSAFFNTIRLPLTFHKPIYPIVEQVYTKSNGKMRRASARINKEFEGYTDVLTDYFHQRIVVALKHDHVLFTNTDTGLVSNELFIQGDYKPDWIDENTIVVASAKLKISMPISDINSNCYSQTTIPCCPPFVTSTTPTDNSFTIAVNFGMFTTSWNLQWRLASSTQWNLVSGLNGRTYTIPGLPAGTEIEYQLQSICGSVTGSWSGTFTGSTTGTAPCDGTVSNITLLQNSQTQATLSWQATGSPTLWYIYIDNAVTPIKAGSPSIVLNNLAVGNHSAKIIPICDNGAQGTPATQPFTIQALPALTLVRTGSNGSTSTNYFQVGPNVQAGNRFTLEVYSHVITVVALAGDTPATIALKLIEAVNFASLLGQWNSAGSAPPSGTPGYPPAAFSQGGGAFYITLNEANEFGGNAYLS